MELLVFSLFNAHTIEIPNTAIGMEACFLSLSLNLVAPTPLVDVEDDEESTRLLCV